MILELVWLMILELIGLMILELVGLMILELIYPEQTNISLDTLSTTLRYFSTPASNLKKVS